MSDNVLYHEYAGAGDDTEASLKHGIVVTLTRFSADSFHAPDHYTLTARVVIDHLIVVDEFQAFEIKGRQTDANMIRKAIARFDQLLDLNPEVNKQFEEV